MYQMIVLPFRGTVHGLEKWDERNLLQFSRGHCKVLCFGQELPQAVVHTED